jgi:hypothetical protein
MQHVPELHIQKRQKRGIFLVLSLSRRVAVIRLNSNEHYRDSKPNNDGEISP